MLAGAVWLISCGVLWCLCVFLTGALKYAFPKPSLIQETLERVLEWDMLDSIKNWVTAVVQRSRDAELGLCHFSFPVRAPRCCARSQPTRSILPPAASSLLNLSNKEWNSLVTLSSSEPHRDHSGPLCTLRIFDGFELSERGFIASRVLPAVDQLEPGWGKAFSLLPAAAAGGSARPLPDATLVQVFVAHSDGRRIVVNDRSMNVAQFLEEKTGACPYPGGIKILVSCGLAVDQLDAVADYASRTQSTVLLVFKETLQFMAANESALHEVGMLAKSLALVIGQHALSLRLSPTTVLDMARTLMPGLMHPRNSTRPLAFTPDGERHVLVDSMLGIAALSSPSAPQDMEIELVEVATANVPAEPTATVSALGAASGTVYGPIRQRRRHGGGRHNTQGIDSPRLNRLVLLRDRPLPQKEGLTAADRDAKLPPHQVIYLQADVTRVARTTTANSNHDDQRTVLFTCRGIANPMEDDEDWRGRMHNFGRRVRQYYPGAEPLVLYKTDPLTILALVHHSALPLRLVRTSVAFVLPTRAVSSAPAASSQL
jgi:hypothetical protein